jgi:SNF2 family DNA or RNA helicase
MAAYFFRLSLLNELELPDSVKAETTKLFAHSWSRLYRSLYEHQLKGAQLLLNAYSAPAASLKANISLNRSLVFSCPVGSGMSMQFLWFLSVLQQRNLQVGPERFQACLLVISAPRIVQWMAQVRTVLFSIPVVCVGF